METKSHHQVCKETSKQMADQQFEISRDPQSILVNSVGQTIDDGVGYR
jgi:hypothetical protein